MKESYCIMCGKKKDGIEIKEDNVIGILRWFNQKVLRIPPKNNRIVVCSECYQKYNTQRKKYVSRQWMYIILGVLFIVFCLISSALGGNIIVGLLLGIGVLLLLYLCSFLIYVPELAMQPKTKEKEGKTARHSK